MDLVRILRILVVAEILFTLVGLAAAFALESTLPQPLQDYLAAESDAPLQLAQVLIMFLALPLLPAMVVAWIGLLRFWKYGPTLYLATQIASVLILLIMGPMIQTAVASALDSVASLLGGVILGLVYFSALRERYTGGNDRADAGGRVEVEGAQ